MINWWGWQYLLELGNGVLAITTGWAVIFLCYHVVKVSRQRRVGIRSWRNLPQALQLAVAILAIAWASCGIAVVIWAARYRHNGYLLVEGVDTIAISMFRVVLIGGFLCALRVITKPMQWRWPWLGAIGSCAIYLLWSAARLF